MENKDRNRLFELYQKIREFKKNLDGDAKTILQEFDYFIGLYNIKSVKDKLLTRLMFDNAKNWFIEGNKHKNIKYIEWSLDGMIEWDNKIGLS